MSQTQQRDGSCSVRLVEKKEEFEQCLKLAGDRLVVVDFYADWCGPCKMIAPKFMKMAEELEDVIFLKVNVDEVEDLAEEYEVTAMPTFKLFRNGKVVDNFMGANDGKLKEMIEKRK